MKNLMTRSQFEPMFSNSPWNAMRDLFLHRGFNRLFDDLAPTYGGSAESSFAPAVDIEESDKNYLVTVDLPGIQKADLKIEVINHYLVISGERKQERKEEKSSRHFVERFHGTFRRTFALPDTVDASHIDAGFQDGVLRVAIPKIATVKPKQIAIVDGKPECCRKENDKNRDSPLQRNAS